MRRRGLPPLAVHHGERVAAARRLLHPLGNPDLPEDAGIKRLLHDGIAPDPTLVLRATRPGDPGEAEEQYEGCGGRTSHSAISSNEEVNGSMGEWVNER